MRILEVCPYDIGRPGGVQQQVMLLARGLRNLGHDVVVAAPGGEVDLGASLLVDANGSKAPVCLRPDVRALRGAAAGVDVVHLHEPLVPMVGWRALGLAPPIVGTFHRAGASRSYRAIGRVMRLRLHHLAGASAVSPLAAHTIRVVAGCEAEVVPNGIELREFAVLAPKVAGRVVFVGRHEPRKGLAVLLEALSMVRTSCELIVAGAGPDSERLRAATTDTRVRFVGQLPRQELVRLLLGAELAVVPSLGGESFGLVVLEALAAGCAVVASDLPAHRWVLGSPPSGALVAPGDARQLARVIQELLQDAPARQRFQSMARERARAFSLDLVVERYLQLFADRGPTR
jgi:phosphatidylinositol alpha-mannosyltransferase